MQILKNITWQHVQEKIILADFYYHFQQNKKIKIILTNVLCILIKVMYETYNIVVDYNKTEMKAQSCLIFLQNVILH